MANGQWKPEHFCNFYRLGLIRRDQLVFKLMTSFRMTESEAEAFMEAQP